MKPKAIIFDIDGTLTEEISWTAFTRDLGGSVDEHLKIYGAMKSGSLGWDESKQRLLEMWQATGNHQQDYILRQFAKWPIKQEAPGLIRRLKQQGYKLCLITGSIDIYARFIAERLGVERYFANAKLIFDAEGNLVDFEYTVDQAGVKLRQLHQFCEEEDLTLRDVVCVGDDNNDIDLFRATGRGILVGNHISAALREASWKQVKSLTEIEAALAD